MKPTTKQIVGTIAIALSFQSGSLAGIPLGNTSALLSINILGQADANKLDRQQVNALLAEARKAIDGYAYDRAESLLQRAEKAKIRYSLFHFGDTPQRVRRDLEKARAKRSQSKPPSQRFNPSPTSSTQNSAKSVPPATNDPFVQRGPGSPSDPPHARFSSDDEKSIPPTASQPTNHLAPADATDRSKSDAQLRDARRALAVGDVRRAREHLEQAKSYNVAYEFHEDSPAKIDAAIRRYYDVVEQRPEREPTDAWRRQYALLLIEQAEALLKWKDYAEAERLASDAARLGLSFGPYEANPQSLLDQIASIRRGSERPTRLTGTTSELAKSDLPRSDKQKVLELLSKARQALDRRDFRQADQRIGEAIALGVPDSAFNQGEDRPWLLALDVQKARARSAGVVTAVASDSAASEFARRGMYYSETDTTHNMPVAHSATASDVGRSPQAFPSPLLAPSDRRTIDRPIYQNADAKSSSYRQPTQAQYNQPTNYRSQGNLRQAYQSNPTDPFQTENPQDTKGVRSGGQSSGSLIDSTASGQQILARQLSAEVAREQAAARKLRETDPKQALESLRRVHQMVANSGLDPSARTQLLRRVDRSIQDTEKYINDNRAQINLDDRNREVLDEIDRRRETKIVIEHELADLVDQFNKLRDEQRYEEMEVVAKRARELAPEETIVQQLWLEARFIRREIMNRQLAEKKEAGVFDALRAVDDSSVPFDDANPFQYGDVKEWDRLTKRRAQGRQEGRRGMSERELEIHRKLSTPVMLEFIDRPLAEVMDQLAELTGINIHLDPLGLGEEGVASDMPVTIKLRREIALKSALNLILQPLNLSYVITDEVLKITSEQLRDGEVYTDTYNVADLVIPIHNFMPGGQFGMQSAINQAHAGALAARGGMNNGALGMASPIVMAQNTPAGELNNNILGNVPGPVVGLGGGGPPVSGTPQAIGMGPGGMGGGAQADFDSLIQLITATIQPESWDEVGGPGSVQPFETNLSLVVSQTQEVHEQIVDLLEQLRRMQDLQVTIEVRFIRLSDSFFERIGVDFDFRIEDGSGLTQADLEATDRPRPSVTVGLDATTSNFTADLDIPFTQDSFSATTPQFGGFDAATAATFGFAILSDIEAFFLITAAQGDSRSNILEAPKVTLFNGQLAFISDSTQRPFVISVIPVVGDFAAAQQPVIAVLSEGTNLSIQAVVSPDRRYVRLTVVPFFSQIGDVQEFTFEGDSTTTTNSSGVDADDDGNNEEESDDNTVRRQGTTVQLPEFSFVTVSTTVSVPDGGTVLLGGIKRLREARNERGVPMLSKLPYLNRLFSNVGIGRDTESLMMMVTPRIIIQEEEEERLGVFPQP